MTGFDYAVIGVIAVSSLLGLWRGVVSEVLALLAWVAAIMAARAWAEPVGAAFATSVAEPALRYALGVVLVVVGVLAVVAVARRLLARLLRAVGLGPVDRLLGAVFGVARGVLIVLVAVLIGGMTTLPKSPWWRDAWLAPPLETAVIAAKPWLPAELAKRIRYR